MHNGRENAAGLGRSRGGLFFSLHIFDFCFIMVMRAVAIRRRTGNGLFFISGVMDARIHGH